MSDPLSRPELHRLHDLLEQWAGSRDGVARQAQWECEDGYLVTYTTSRIAGGPHDGRFLVQLHRPVGPGARCGQAQRWQEVKRRQFSTRKAARKRATELYLQHSPVMARRWADAGRTP